MNQNAHNDAPKADAQTQILYDLINGQAAPDRVRNFLSDSYNVIARIQQAPGYVQPNGFLTFKLGGLNDDRLLRLHLWPEGLPETGDTAGVHDHVFDFTSLVLAGNGPMVNTIYTPEQQDDGSLTLYAVDYTSPKTSHLIRLGDHFAAAETTRSTIHPGEYYQMKAGVFHTSQIQGNAMAITLLATRMGPAAAQPRFLSAHQPAMDYTRPPLTDDHRKTLINYLQKIL